MCDRKKSILKRMPESTHTLAVLLKTARAFKETKIEIQEPDVINTASRYSTKKGITKNCKGLGWDLS